MRSIVNALNNIAIALGNIALAIDSNKKKTNISNTSFTSNNSPNPEKIRYTGFENHAHTSSAEVYNKRLHKAFVDKGHNPKHHDSMMEDLRKKWPVLYYALSDFSKFQNKINKRIDTDIYKNNKDI